VLDLAREFVNPLLAIVRAIHFVTALVPAGVLMFLLAVARPSMKHASATTKTAFIQVERRFFSVLLWSIVFAFASGFVWLWIEGMLMSKLSWLGSLRILGTILEETHFGRLWSVRLGTAFCLGVCLLFVRRRHLRLKRVASGELIVAWLLAAMFVCSLSFAGHAAATANLAASLTADAVHLLVASIWPTGLLPLAMFLREARSSTDLSMTLPGVTRRFSALSLMSVAALSASGLANSCFLVGSVRALLVTTYGQLLVLKLVLFAVAVSFGAMNMLCIEPALGADTTHRTGNNLAQLLNRNVVIEICLGIAILLVVGVLGITPPATHPG
jgi:putative copper resistance protein D